MLPIWPTALWPCGLQLGAKALEYSYSYNSNSNNKHSQLAWGLNSSKIKKNSNKHAQLAWGLNSLLKIKNSMLDVKETTC
jgi:hypothetical protein